MDPLPDDDEARTAASSCADVVMDWRAMRGAGALSADAASALAAAAAAASSDGNGDDDDDDEVNAEAEGFAAEIEARIAACADRYLQCAKCSSTHVRTKTR